jgi:hypothetical protein
MTQLTPIQLDDGTIIYMETKEEIELVWEPNPTGEVTRGDLGRGAKGPSAEQVVRSFQVIEGTIRAYTNYTLKAFSQVANANIDKVKLEFGIKVGGKAGIPYVTEGSADCNLKVTVECSFPPQDK